MNPNPFLEFTEVICNGCSVKPDERSELYYAGKALSLGIENFGKNESFATDALLQYMDSGSEIVEKCAILGIGFCCFGSKNKKATAALKKKNNGKNKDFKKSALLVLGLVYAKTNDKNMFKWFIDRMKRSQDWEIKAFAGIGLSFLSCGAIKNKEFWKIIDMFNKEKNGYVKVCWSWIISLAFAGTNQTKEYNKLLKTGDDYLRDASVLGLAFSGGDKNINALLEGMMHDEHPYVRESARLALGIKNIGKNNKHQTVSILDSLKSETNTVVITGSIIGSGLINYSSKDNAIASRIMDVKKGQEFSTRWSNFIACGLINADKQIELQKPDKTNEFELWGYTIGTKISGCRSAKKNCSADVACIAEPIHNALKQQDLKIFLLLLPIMYYILFDAFWWCLWTVGMIQLKNQEGLK